MMTFLKCKQKRSERARKGYSSPSSVRPSIVLIGSASRVQSSRTCDEHVRASSALQSAGRPYVHKDTGWSGRTVESLTNDGAEATQFGYLTFFSTIHGTACSWKV